MELCIVLALYSAAVLTIVFLASAMDDIQVAGRLEWRLSFLTYCAMI